MFKAAAILVAVLVFIGCSKKGDDSPTEYQASGAAPRYLYLATGSCYGAGNTTFTAVNATNYIYRISLGSGRIDGIMPTIDFSSPGFSTGDSPVGLADIDGSAFYALVDNATVGSRRMIKFSKATGSALSMPLNNATIFSSALTYLLKLSDNTFFIGRGAALEKVNSQFQRQNPTGILPWVGSPTPATCATTNNRITSAHALQNGKVLYTHASTAANTSNKTVIISATGYATTSDCLQSQAGPAGNPYATFSQYIPMTATTGQLLVSYGFSNTTALMNSIYSYDLDESTLAFSSPIKSYEDSSVLYAIPTMVYDSDERSLYVASAISTSTTVAGYKIEKFQYSTTTKLLTRVSNSGLPFSAAIPSSATKCISQMMIAN
jgi:hypothetical protein